MKNVMMASALLSGLGTAAFACSVEEATTLSNLTSDTVVELVAQDDANLGKAMHVMTLAAVAEYHSEKSAVGCVRQRETLYGLKELHKASDVEQSAMLKIE